MKEKCSNKLYRLIFSRNITKIWLWKKMKNKGSRRKRKFNLTKFKNEWNFWQFTCNNSCTEGFQEYYIQDIFHQIVQLCVQNVHFHVQIGFAEQVLAHSKLQLQVSICALNNLYCNCKLSSTWNHLRVLVYYIKMFISDVCGKILPVCVLEGIKL